MEEHGSALYAYAYTHFHDQHHAEDIVQETLLAALKGADQFQQRSSVRTWLETAVRLKLDLLVLVLRDNAYGMIKWKQANMGFNDFGLDYGNPDFPLYAKSYGAHGHRLTSATELSELLEACFTQGGVHLIEVPVDYSENDRILNHLDSTNKCIT
ncbi:MAG: thiamine pyrophosphate-dependent enzyme [Gammaproteobacteria bacterium]|nr:thiamine pyrophosphate-dependent enzyme [Gammaproteobacteria bacterium]